MSALHGRALHGLDEFMLRLGHLRTLCRIAVKSGGSAHRFERHVAAQLMQMVEVPLAARPALSRYLEAKKLCPTQADRESPGFDHDRFRYPDLTLAYEAADIPAVVTSSKLLQVTWQDLCLASDGVSSRVGGVNTGGKRGSKTGLSHVIDWAQMLDLVNSSGVPSATGQLLGKFDPQQSSHESNPYVIGNERVAFAATIIRYDFDVFSALVKSLANVETPIRKKEAIQIYVEAVRTIVRSAEATRDLSPRQRHSLFGLWRDLRRPGRVDQVVESTAWHRVASRLETYVDIGILGKGVASEDERYEYKYYVTDRLKAASKTLDDVRDLEGWIGNHLADMLSARSSSTDPMQTNELLAVLPDLVEALARPTAPLPLNALTSGLVWLTAELGKPLSFAAARRSLENLALSRPDLARLSTGATSKPEYISFRN